MNQLFFESRTLDCPSENYTLLRYHIALLAIDDQYNYAQSTRSNLLLIYVYFLISLMAVSYVVEMASSVRLSPL